MKFKKIISVETLSRRSMLRPCDFFKRIRLHAEILPDICPMKWGWWEPLTHVWDLADMNSFIPPDRGGKADMVAWSRTSKNKAFGIMGVNILPKADSERYHATESIYCELDAAPWNSLIKYIKVSAVQLDCDICFIHHIGDEEARSRGIESDFEGVVLSRYRDGSEKKLSISAHTLPHWLPSLPWAIVFGDAYVRMFGMERLLSVPAFKVEKLSESAVYIQLTPKLSDLETDYPSFEIMRLRAQRHLGQEAFFDADRAYPLRGPIGEMSSAEFRKALADFRCPPPGTNGFKVPEFHFIED